MPVPNHTQNKVSHGKRPSRQQMEMLLVALGHLCLWSSWLFLYAPTIQWLGATFSHEAYRLHLLIGLGIIALFAQKLRKWMMISNEHRFIILLAPRFTFWPIIGASGFSILYLIIENLWDIDILSATCFGLGTYSLLGLWLSRDTWKRGLPAALLLIAVLPFSTHMDQLAGFPARIFTAQLSQKMLGALQIKSISTQSILILENGIAHVDLPCSGIKSLWSGAIFFLALTWILQHALNLRWLLSGALFLFILLISNTMRVVVLVLVAVVAQQHKLAEIIHVPMGIFGFLFAGGIAYLLLSLAKPRTTKKETPPSKEKRLRLSHSTLLFTGLISGIWILSAAHQERTKPQPNKHKWALTLPNQFHPKPIPLTIQETDLYQRHGAANAKKYAFQYNKWKGSVLLVRSTSWRAHHPPEICLAGSGFKVSSLHTIHPLHSTKHPIAKHEPSIRILHLGTRKRTAVYWYQSRFQTTDILLKRILGSIRKREKRWVMVSILFDRHVSSKELLLSSIFRQFHTLVHQHFPNVHPKR